MLIEIRYPVIDKLYHSICIINIFYILFFFVVVFLGNKSFHCENDDNAHIVIIITTVIVSFIQTIYHIGKYKICCCNISADYNGRYRTPPTFYYWFDSFVYLMYFVLTVANIIIESVRFSFSDSIIENCSLNGWIRYTFIINILIFVLMSVSHFMLYKFRRYNAYDHVVMTSSVYSN